VINAFAVWLDNDAHFYLFIGSLLVIGACLRWVIKHFRSEPPSFRSRGEEAGVPEERDDEKQECAEGPDCDFCKGMDAYIASDIRKGMDDRLASEVAVNMALADIADHEPDIRRIERKVLAEEELR
jgi:hypothetical protein